MMLQADMKMISTDCWQNAETGNLDNTFVNEFSS